MKKILFLILGVSFVGFLVFVNKPIKQPVHTTITVYNATHDSVQVWLTLSAYPNQVSNVNGIFGITQSGLQGFFYLAGYDSISDTSSQAISANISFGLPPLNCPTSQWKLGINLFEYNLNLKTNESIDISCVTGNNCVIECKCIGGPNWEASPYYPNLREFKNSLNNTNVAGVMPLGCTDCVDTNGRPECVPYIAPASVDSARICNPTRAAGQKGGEVLVQFNGFFEILSSKK